MTDHHQAALTAMQDQIYWQLNCQYGDFNIPSNEEVEAILAAVEPYMRKKWATEVIEELDTARATGKVYTYGDVQELIRNGVKE